MCVCERYLKTNFHKNVALIICLLLAVYDNITSEVEHCYQSELAVNDHITFKYAYYYLSELCVLPAVYDNITAGVEEQEQVREVGQQVAPWGRKVNKNTLIVLTMGTLHFQNII